MRLYATSKRNIALTVHGDDFLVVADLAQMKWLEKQLKDKYETKSTIIGPEPELAKELQILNRTLRWNDDDRVRGRPEARQDDHRGVRGRELQAFKDPRSSREAQGPPGGGCD